MVVSSSLLLSFSLLATSINSLLYITRVKLVGSFILVIIHNVSFSLFFFASLAMRVVYKQTSGFSLSDESMGQNKSHYCIGSPSRFFSLHVPVGPLFNSSLITQTKWQAKVCPAFSHSKRLFSSPKPISVCVVLCVLIEQPTNEHWQSRKENFCLRVLLLFIFMNVCIFYFFFFFLFFCMPLFSFWHKVNQLT